MINIEIFVLAGIAYLLAGTVKGTVGIGLPTTSIGILSQFTDPRLAIAVVVFPILLSNSYQIWREGRIVETLRRYKIFAVVLMVFLFGSTQITASISTQTLIIILGSVMVLFALSNFIATPPAIPQKYDSIAQVTAGATSGLIGGLTSIWAPPMVIYLLSRRVDKTEFIRATGLLILLGGISLAIGFWNAGLLTTEISLLSIAMIVPTLLGFRLGEYLRTKLDATRFRQLVLILFLVMGLNLIRKAVLV